MVDAAMLIYPSGVYLPKTLLMLQSTHARLHVVMETLIGCNHPATKIIEAFGMALVEQEIDLEEYYIRKQSIKPKIPSLLKRWSQIYLSDWIYWQWE